MHTQNRRFSEKKPKNFFEHKKSRLFQRDNRRQIKILHIFDFNFLFLRFQKFTEYIVNTIGILSLDEHPIFHLNQKFNYMAVFLSIQIEVISISHLFFLHSINLFCMTAISCSVLVEIKICCLRSTALTLSAYSFLSSCFSYGSFINLIWRCRHKCTFNISICSVPLVHSIASFSDGRYASRVMPSNLSEPSCTFKPFRLA